MFPDTLGHFEVWVVPKKRSFYLVLRVKDHIYESSCIEVNFRCTRMSNMCNKIYFANGGDRSSDNTPELKRYALDPRVEFVWSVGGDDKINSSSWILDKYYQERESICG